MFCNKIVSDQRIRCLFYLFWISNTWSTCQLIYSLHCFFFFFFRKRFMPAGAWCRLRRLSTWLGGYYITALKWWSIWKQLLSPRENWRYLRKIKHCRAGLVWNKLLLVAPLCATWKCSMALLVQYHYKPYIIRYWLIVSNVRKQQYRQQCGKATVLRRCSSISTE